MKQLVTIESLSEASQLDPDKHRVNLSALFGWKILPNEMLEAQAKKHKMSPEEFMALLKKYDCSYPGVVFFRKCYFAAIIILGIATFLAAEYAQQFAEWKLVTFLVTATIAYPIACFYISSIAFSGEEKEIVSQAERDALCLIKRLLRQFNSVEATFDGIRRQTQAGLRAMASSISPEKMDDAERGKRENLARYICIAKGFGLIQTAGKEFFSARDLILSAHNLPPKETSKAV